MNVSSKTAHATAQRHASYRITMLMQVIVERVGGILARHADRDGNVMVAHLDAIRGETHDAVQPLFVARRPVANATAELSHLQDLITGARTALDGASQAETQRITARLRLLSARYALLAGRGISLTAIEQGRALTPYSRIILEEADAVTRAAVEAHAMAMRRLLNDAPDVMAWLEHADLPQLGGGGRFPLAQHQPVTSWLDTRGYTLSDRIWNIGEATTTRIDALLADGIAQGRSAVQIAEDLEQFLLPPRQGILTRKPYGTNGSYDARRLARSEITRAHAVAGHAAALNNPFVTRGYWNLSPAHVPDPGDICEKHAAYSDEHDGWPVAEVKLPMIDSHPHCLCTVSYGTADHALVIQALREEMDSLSASAYQISVAQPVAVQAATAPITPLATGLMVDLLLGAAYAYATRQVAA